MSYTLYGSGDSANIIVQMILEQLEAPYKNKWVDRARLEQREAPFLALNPQGLLPVLLEQDEQSGQESVLFETAAICLYLSEKHQGEKHQTLTIADHSAPQYKELLSWLFFLSNSLHADLRVLFYGLSYVKGNDGQASQDILMNAVKGRLARHFALVENQLSKSPDGPWFLGDRMTILDFYHAALCRWSLLYPVSSPNLRATHRDFCADRLPYHRRLLSAVEALPAVHRAARMNRIKPPFFLDPTIPDLPLEKIIGR